MKITIDTKEDSSEEITKILEVLSGFAKQNNLTPCQNQQPAQQPTDCMGMLFSDNKDTPQNKPSSAPSEILNSPGVSVLDAIFGSGTGKTTVQQQASNQQIEKPSIPRIRVMQY